MSLNKVKTPHGKTQRCQTLQSEGPKIPKTERQIYVQMSRTAFTHNLALSGSSRLLHQIPNTVAATQIMFNCSTFYFIMAPRARQTTMIVETAPGSYWIHRRHRSWGERVERFNSFQNRWAGLQRHF